METDKVLALLRDAAGNLYMAYNAFTRNDAIAWEPLKETADRITALLDSGIKDAGDAVVEPEYLIRLRNALKGFKSDGAFAGDKDIVDYIDSLQSALQVAQQDRDNCYASLDNVRRRLHEIETFVTGDANEYRINKKLKDDEKSIKSLIEHLLAMADNYHTVNQLYIQAKDRAEKAEQESLTYRNKNAINEQNAIHYKALFETAEASNKQLVELLRDCQGYLEPMVQLEICDRIDELLREVGK